MGYQKICWIDRCPDETCIRVAEPDGRYRRDMCKYHGLLTVWYYRSKIQVVDMWNGLTNDEVNKAKEEKPNE